MRRRNGFSLAELVIATTIVLVVASVAIPAARSRRLLANEACAVVTLRDIASAQERFKAAVLCDLDHDGVGEYGLLRELSGRSGIRSNDDASLQGPALVSPILPRSFGAATRGNELARVGYLFHIVLPGFDARGVPEASGVAAQPSAINANLAETTWGCYARPQRFGRTGDQTFFTNQTGDIVATESREILRPRDRLYSGRRGAAFLAGGDPLTITGQLAIGTVGRDGNFWRLVTPRAERDLVSRWPLNVEGRYGFPNRHGSIAMESRESATRTDETLLVRAVDLEPRTRYVVLGEQPGPAPSVRLGSVEADSGGRATFRLDSRLGPYPDGLSSLTQLVRGSIRLEAAGVRPAFADLVDSPCIDRLVPSTTFIDANEAEAIDGLRQIAAAQAQFRAANDCDVNKDGVGEFGLLRELTGVSGVRAHHDGSTQGPVLDPPLLSRAFSAFNSNHELVRSGYLFHIVLPDQFGRGVLEVSGTSALANAIGSDLAATTWCCYAWPQRYGRTGKRTFFIDQSGDIVTTGFDLYSGTAAIASANAGAAFASGGYLTDITGQVAIGTRGRDSQFWRPVADRPADHEFNVHGTLAAVSAGPGVAGTFSITSRQLRRATDETIDVRVKGLSTPKQVLLVLSDATQSATTTLEGWIKSDGAFTHSYRYLGWYFPLHIAVDVHAFSGGTIELRDGETVLLRGPIPTLPTVLGPSVPNASVTFHVAKPLDPAPNQLPRRGSLDVRVTNAPEGLREELTIDVATYDRDAEPYGLFVLDDLAAATPLGTIAVRGLRGTGRLSLDTSRGDVVAGGGLVALSGRTIEVRTPTGFVVLTATLPTVD